MYKLTLLLITWLLLSCQAEKQQVNYSEPGLYLAGSIYLKIDSTSYDYTGKEQYYGWIYFYWTSGDVDSVSLEDFLYGEEREKIKI